MTPTQDSDTKQLMLHEAVSKSFVKTPKGDLFTKDMKVIYSLMLLCLDLTEKSPKHSKISLLNRSYPYSFTIQDAISKMGNLSSTIESSQTKTTVSYSIKPDLAISLIRKFMSAKLLHTPADRTRSEPKEKVLLQPTPKGVAVLQTYCKLHGMKNFKNVPILNSTFNSMDLFLFERSTIADTIIYSEYFVHLLFARFIGSFPNVWKATNPHDEIPSLHHRLQIDDEFEFSNYASQSFALPGAASGLPIPEPDTEPEQSSKSTISSRVSKKPKIRESPFAHNFFTNPESDSHVQYYVSNKGVRLYGNYKFGDLTVKYSFNAKAAWQWLMDCTDIIHPTEATVILNLFYKYNLIEPIIVPPSTATSKKNFRPLKTSFYTLSKKGLELSHWTSLKRNIIVVEDDEITRDPSSLSLSNAALTASEISSDEEITNYKGPKLDISKVLSDPGMRYLFRTHLENEFCAENLDVYIDIKHFTKKMTILKNIWEAHEKKQDIILDKKTIIKPPSRRALVKLNNECLSSVYNIYSSYISVGAPYQLNIDHLLREKITETMIHTNSPLKARFSGAHTPILEVMERFETPPMTPSIIPQAAYVPKSPRVAIQIPEDAHLKSESNLAFELTSSRRLNTKNLSVEIINEDSNTGVPGTPTEEELVRSLELLQKLFPLIEFVGKQILKLLENDSFPKFLSSETFLNALK